MPCTANIYGSGVNPWVGRTVYLSSSLPLVPSTLWVLSILWSPSPLHGPPSLMDHSRSSEWNKALSVAFSVTSTNSDILTNTTNLSKSKVDCNKFSQLHTFQVCKFPHQTCKLFSFHWKTKAIMSAASSRQVALELQNTPSMSITLRRNVSDKDNASSTVSSVALPRADTCPYVSLETGEQSNSWFIWKSSSSNLTAGPLYLVSCNKLVWYRSAEQFRGQAQTHSKVSAGVACLKVSRSMGCHCKLECQHRL